MSTQLSPSNASVRTVQIIAGALMWGVIVFGVIVYVQRGDQAPEEADLLAHLGLGAAAVLVLATIAFGLATAWRVRRRIDPGAFLEMDDEARTKALQEQFSSSMIVRLALLEGGAFFNLVAFMVEGHTLSLIVAGVLLFGMALLFPSRPRIEAWMRVQARELEEA